MLSNISPATATHLVALICLVQLIVVLVLGLMIVMRADKRDLPAVTRELRKWFSRRRR